MLDYWDRICIYFSVKFNISKSKVSIILALAIVKFVALAVIFMFFVCRSSKSSETPEPFSPNGSNDELILAQTVSEAGKDVSQFRLIKSLHFDCGIRFVGMVLVTQRTYSKMIPAHQ